MSQSRTYGDVSHHLGRFHVAESPAAFRRLHFHNPETTALKTSDHEPRVGVLDQEDLHAQGIDCSTFIAGAGNPDALGSCTCNAMTAALSNLMDAGAFGSYVANLGSQQVPAHPFVDTVAAERAAIGAYHQVTDQTDTPSQEWPPTDCGSSGPYLYQWALTQHLIRTEAIAHDADSVVSLMVRDGLLIGMPWFNQGFEPDAHGFIDGDGSVGAIRALIRSGVAGGHEIYISAVEKLGLDAGGHVIPQGTVVRLRNSWNTSWGDAGSFRMHLSTLGVLRGQIDVRQFRIYQ